jgi:nicotinamidase/pyrazinamidase
MRESLPRYGDGVALIVTDVQNDFASPGGSLYVRTGEAVVPVINVQIGLALEAGSPVVYTQDWHPIHTPHFERDGGIWPVHCVRGTWGAEFHPDLRVGRDVVRKGTGGEDGYSGFSVRDPSTGRVEQTILERVLRDRGIRSLVLTGIATDYCVKETALDGLRMGFQVRILREAVRAVDLQADDGERALAEVEAAGGRVE